MEISLIQPITSEYLVITGLFSAQADYFILSSQDETSEKIIGEWMEKRDIRDQVFVATKVSIGQVQRLNYRLHFS